MIRFIVILGTILFLVCNSEAAEKCGKEWALERAIQVAPTGSSNPKWPKWKAKLGFCTNGEVNFINEAYFNQQPNAKMLTNTFSEPVHLEPWHTISEKDRTFYIFESDWLKHQKSKLAKVASLQAIYSLLLLKKEKRQSGPGNLAYTPENPSPTAQNEGNLTINGYSWQTRYPIGAMFCQVQVRNDGAKVKFGRRITNTQIRWFDIRYQIPVDSNWMIGIAPFNLSETFTGYVFHEEQYPEDEKDIWTARVYVPGYKHPVYTPENPNEVALNENIISLSDKSWQQIYANGTLFVQVEVRNDGAKVKFLRKSTDSAKAFAVFRKIPVIENWVIGNAPINLHKTFPEYNFGGGFAPVNKSTHWSAQVYIP